MRMIYRSLTTHMYQQLCCLKAFLNWKHHVAAVIWLVAQQLCTWEVSYCLLVMVWAICNFVVVEVNHSELPRFTLLWWWPQLVTTPRSSVTCTSGTLYCCSCVADMATYILSCLGKRKGIGAIIWTNFNKNYIYIYIYIAAVLSTILWLCSPSRENWLRIFLNAGNLWVKHLMMEPQCHV